MAARATRLRRLRKTDAQLQRTAVNRHGGAFDQTGQIDAGVGAITQLGTDVVLQIQLTHYCRGQAHHAIAHTDIHVALKGVVDQQLQRVVAIG